jgi:hypothetical protein
VAVELVTHTKIGLWMLDLLWENMPISIKIKVWIKNLNVSGILIIMFETKTLFFIKMEFNGLNIDYMFYKSNGHKIYSSSLKLCK